MQAGLAGRPGTGLLDVAYGAELALYGRIHTTVLGQEFNWEGQIPIPWIPEDLLIGATAAFDPTVEPTGVARVTDSTDPVTVISTNLLSSIISLGGISGGLYVTVTGSMATSYRTRSAAFAGATVDAATDRVSIARPSDGFSSSLQLPVALDGVVRYEPALTFAAGFDLRLLGIRVVDWQLVSIPMTLPPIERAVKLTGDPFRIGLPQLDGIGEGARMDFATGNTQSLRIKNDGAARLELAAVEAPPGVSLQSIVLAPGGETSLSVTIDDGALASGTAQLVLETNDPDRARLLVDLGRDVGGTDPGEPPGESSGCASGKRLDLGALLLLALVVVRRRRPG
jgi:hypothetical protein